MRDTDSGPFSFSPDSSHAQLFYFESERRHTQTHTHTGEIRFSASSLVNRPKINHGGNCIKVYARQKVLFVSFSFFPSLCVHFVLSSLILFLIFYSPPHQVRFAVHQRVAVKEPVVTRATCVSEK